MPSYPVKTREASFSKKSTNRKAAMRQLNATHRSRPIGVGRPNLSTNAKRDLTPRSTQFYL